MIAEILGLIDSVPDVIWSGVIASGLTLGGVLISNRSNTTRLNDQLRHDSSEKARERHAALRREVYLRVVEELSKISSHLSSLPQKDPSKENVGEGVQGFAIAASQLQLVAEPKTALLANELSAKFGELAVRAIGRALPLQQTRGQISLQDDLYNQAHSQVQRVLSDIARFNESGQTDQRIWQSLQRAFEGFMAQSSRHAEERGKLWEDFNRLNLEFQAQLMSDLRVLGEKQVELLIEIRRDLGLLTDIDAFKKQLEAQSARLSSEMLGLFRQMDAEARSGG